jgi:hypothetical protein
MGGSSCFGVDLRLFGGFTFPAPNGNYYLNVLGDRAARGLNLRPELARGRELLATGGKEVA